MDVLNNFASLLVQGLLIIALPILVAAGIAYARARWNEVKHNMSKEQLEMLGRIGKIAVKAAEQAGLSGQLASGSEKREYAIRAVEKYLTGLGITIDVGAIEALIESEVIEQFKGGGASPAAADTAEARSQLLERAVQVAVLAAEQSGLKQIAADAAVSVALSKKDYALDMAQRYLSEHGVKIDEELVDGLIEAQIMKFKMDSARK